MKKQIKTSLFGLILAGGQSTRMGSDKGKLEYYGMPQRKHLFDLASNYCDKVFYSIRKDQTEEFQDMSYIVDENNYRGPLNGILSAHSKFPDVGWLVLACDLPLFDTKNLKALITKRDDTRTATAFATKKSKLPEPLVAIWEPQGLEAAKQFMDKVQSSCPRKFLIESDVKLVHPTRDEILYNANSLTEYMEAKKLLST